MPFAADVGGVAVLKTGGVPYLRHSVAMERRYEQLAPAMPHFDALLRRDPAAGTSWERVVQKARLSKDALNVATWLQAARTTAKAPHNVFNCPFCELPCAGWGPHLLAACGKVALAVQAGFHALILAAAPVATVPEWMTTAWVRLGLPGGDSVHLVLRADHQVTVTWPPARPHTVYLTWSGMLMGTCAEASRGLTAARRGSLASVYLEALPTYAWSAAWDVFPSGSNGPVSGWTHGLLWQHAACLSALLQMYDRCHSSGGVPRCGRGGRGGARVPSGFRRADMFSACRHWWWSGACLGRCRCTPLEPGAGRIPARTCACSSWRPIVDVCARRHSAARAGGGANSPMSSAARQLHSGPRQRRPRGPSRGFGPGSVGVIPRASRAAAQPCGRRTQGSVGLPHASSG